MPCSTMYVTSVASTGASRTISHERGVREADGDGGADHRQHAEEQPPPLCPAPAKNDMIDDDEARERPDREVDPAGQHDDQLAERDEPQRAREQEHADEVELGQEAVVRRRRVQRRARR